MPKDKIVKVQELHEGDETEAFWECFETNNRRRYLSLLKGGQSRDVILVILEASMDQGV